MTLVPPPTYQVPMMVRGSLRTHEDAPAHVLASASPGAPPLSVTLLAGGVA